MKKRWASGGVNGPSYTWGEAGILSDKKEVKVERIKIFENRRACYDWQRHKFSIYKNSDWVKNVEKGNGVGIWLRSLYPAWACHAQQASITVACIPKDVL